MKQKMNIVFFIFSLFFSINVLANDTLFVKLDFLNASKKEVKVEVKPRFKNIEIPMVLFIKNTRGSEKIEYTDIAIKANTKVAQEEKTSWWIKDITAFEQLDFTIKIDNFASNRSRTPALIKLVDEDFYFAQLMACLPILTVPQNYIVALELNFNEKLYCPLVNSGEVIYFDNQFLASKQSIIIGDFQNTNIITEKNDTLNLLYYTDYKLIKLHYLEKLLTPFINNLDTFMNPLKPVNQQLILCCFKNAVGLKHDYWGGVANTDYSLITLPAVRSVSKFNEILYQTLSHEYLHAITPFNLHTEKTFTAVRSDENYSKHLWLYEGVVEYLSWKFLLQNEYISERSFMDHFGEKIKNGNLEKVSLSQLSMHIHNQNNAEKSAVFYERGAVIALLLDILINEYWKGEKDLQSVLYEMIDKDEIYDDATFIAKFEKIAHPTIGTFLRKVLDNNQLIKPNEVLKKIGWKYDEHSEEIVATYGVFKIKPNYKKPYFKIVDVGRNQLGFQNNDALQAVNGKELTIRNGNDLLAALRTPNLNDTIEIDLIRNGELVKVSGVPGELQTSFYHVIRPKKDVSSEAKVLKNWLLED